MRAITIPDEEIKNAGLVVLLETGDFSHSFVSWFDRKAGFKTHLIKYHYDLLSCMHEFIIEN